MHPISYFHAIVLGLLQGVAEPFPISSLGHGVILPRLAGWDIRQTGSAGRRWSPRCARR